MGFLSSWKSLGAVMVLTIHVAVVASVIRSWVGASSSAGLWFWVVVAIGSAVGLSWPIGLAIASAFDPGEAPVDRTCLRCGRREIRPLIRAGGGLFQPVTGYRCAACLTTYREAQAGGLEAQTPFVVDSSSPEGIAYLSDPLTEQEIRFLDDESGSPGQLGSVANIRRPSVSSRIDDTSEDSPKE